MNIYKKIKYISGKVGVKEPAEKLNQECPRASQNF